MLMPGAQSLASAMLGDAWSATRDAIARRWGRAGRAELTEAQAHLEASRARANTLVAGTADPAQRDRILVAYWIGYLAALLDERPDLGEAISSLRPAPAAAPRGDVHNNTSGTVNGSVVQARDISGGVNYWNR
jgi:hypothetical protein